MVSAPRAGKKHKPENYSNARNECVAVVELLKKSRKACETEKCGISCVFFCRFPSLGCQKSHKRHSKCTAPHESAVPVTASYFLWARRRLALAARP